MGHLVRWLAPILLVALAATMGDSWGAAALQAASLTAGDVDHDGDVDTTDAGAFASCLTGAGYPHDGSDACDEVDLDHDGDVDLEDFSAIQLCFTGPGIPGDPTCGGCVLPRANRSVGVSSSPIAPHQSTFVTVAASQTGVDYQLRNNSNNAHVNIPVAGNGGIISLPTGDLNSTTTFNVLAINSAWGCSAQLSSTATVTVSTSVPKNKIGVHVVIGSRNGYGDFLQRCADASKPVALVKCVDDYGAAFEAKQRSPQTLTMGRKNDTPNYDLQGFDAYADPASPSYTPPAVFAQTIFTTLKSTWDQNSWIDVWEICNEWSWWWAWQADFYIAMMDICESTQPPVGHPPYRIALYGCSGGNPPEAFWPDIARACARAKAHGDHLLSLHEYAWSGLLQEEYAANGDDIVLRYRRLYAYLRQHNADCRLALTEVGENGGGGFVGVTPFVNDFGWYDTQLRQDDYVVGCAAWTLGNWSGANFQNALPALADYIIAH